MVVSQGKMMMESKVNLPAFLDGLELLQKKRVRLRSATSRDRRAIYAIKAALGDQIRSFEYHGRTDAADAYAVMAFNDRAAFDAVLTSVNESLGVRLSPSED